MTFISVIRLIHVFYLSFGAPDAVW